MTAEATADVPAGALAWVLRGYRLLDLDLEADAHALGVDPAALLAAPHARVSKGLYAGLLHRALERRPDFALEAGRRCELGTFPLLDCTTSACPSLRAAVHALVRYFAIITTNADWTLGGATLTLTPRGDMPEWFRVATFEFGLHYTAARFDELVDGAVVERLDVSWPTPTQASAYPWPTRFAAPRAALVIEESALDRPSRRADPLVAELLAKNAAAIVEAFPRARTARQPVQEAIVELLPQGLPSMPAVARALGTSARTLRRRLAADGLTFETVRDDALEAIACERLGDPSLTVAEVAYILGFSSTRAFHRAFQRWTGTTPGRYRRGVVAQ